MVPPTRVHAIWSHPLRLQPFRACLHAVPSLIFQNIFGYIRKFNSNRGGSSKVKLHKHTQSACSQKKKRKFEQSSKLYSNSGKHHRAHYTKADVLILPPTKN